MSAADAFGLIVSVLLAGFLTYALARADRL